MANLIKEVKSINHKLSTDELAELSQKNAMLNIEIEEKKLEGKNITAQYSNKVKTLEAKRQEISQKILAKCELREVFCYARKNFATSTIEYISMEGEIIMEEHFRPSDYRKQLELKEEVAQQKLSKIQYFGMKYFYDEFLNIKEVTMDSGLQDVYEALEKNRTKFISKCITHLVEDKQILELDDAVEFDAMYEIVSGWFDEYEKKYYEAPREEDYIVEEILVVSDESKEEPPHQEEKPKGKKGKKKDDSQDKDNDNEMPEWLSEN